MIIFLGLAGSGKSTQGQLLAKRLGCQWLSTGQLLRNNIKDKKILEEMLQGAIISDDLLLPLLEQTMVRLSEDDEEMVLDGSPRTLEQARWLVEKVKQYGLKATAVIHLNASKEVVKKRLLARGRPDDHEEAINERFSEYESKIKPILDYLKSQGYKVYDINGEQTKEAVEEEIDRAIGTGS